MSLTQSSKLNSSHHCHSAVIFERLSLLGISFLSSFHFVCHIVLKVKPIFGNYVKNSNIRLMSRLRRVITEFDCRMTNDLNDRVKQLESI